MGAVQGRHVEAADLRIAQVCRHRLFRSLEQLRAVENLENAAVERPVSQIKSIALRPRRDRAVQVGRHCAGRARLMTGEPEVANLPRVRRIAEVVDLQHALRAPARHAGNEEADAGVAFPPALVRVPVIAADPADELGRRRVGHVPDFMRRGSECAQQVDRGRIAFGQSLAVAGAHHLRASGFRSALLARNMREISGLRRIGDVHDRCAVEFTLAGQRVHRLRHVARAVMADIGDVALALLVNDRLIGAARLQIVEADEPHVFGLRRIGDVLGVRRNGRCKQSDDDDGTNRWARHE